MFAVTSSPVTPSPRVAPRPYTPSSYVNATATPSIFSSHAKLTFDTPRATRSAHAFSSSIENALSSEYIRA